MLPVNRFGRRLFDFDNFFGQNLDFFNPFEQWDTSIQQPIIPTMNWVTAPGKLFSNLPPIHDKYRLTMKIHGYNKDEIKTTVEGKQLVVFGRHIEKSGDDYNLNEMKKHFPLPDNLDASRLVSFLTPDNTLVVEIPIKQTAPPKRFVNTPSPRMASVDTPSTSRRSSDKEAFDFEDFFRSSFNPSIIDTFNGQKKLEMKMNMHQYKPEQIQLTLRDRDLILKAESKDDNKNDPSAKSYFYKQITLPPGADIDNLRSRLEDGILYIEAPYVKLSTQKSSVNLN